MPNCCQIRKRPMPSTGRPRAAMRELLTVKNNVDRVLAMEQTEPQQKKTTASGELVAVKSVRRTRSHRLKICVPRGLGGIPSTSAWGYLDSHKHRLPVSSERYP